MKKAMKTQLTLGPLMHHWDAEKRRDFYFRMADEAPVDRVYLGEVVCSKREPFFEPYFQQVQDRLQKAGKEVVLSTLSLVTTDREMELIRSACKDGALIEANDVSCIRVLDNTPFVVGPFINVFNEGALAFLKKKGAVRLVMSMELRANSMKTIAKSDPSMETEVMVFGRQPLTISMRCYSARAYGIHKDGCQFACGRDPDGLPADTIKGQKLLSINGTQVQSHGYAVLLEDMGDLCAAGISAFRLSPQNLDMVDVAKIYRETLDGSLSSTDALAKLRSMTDVPFINGYARGIEGMGWVDDACAKLDAATAS